MIKLGADLVAIAANGYNVYRLSTLNDKVNTKNQPLDADDKKALDSITHVSYIGAGADLIGGGLSVYDYLQHSSPGGSRSVPATSYSEL